MRAVLCVLLLACATQAMAPANSGVLSRVADSFVSRGYVRADPFELSPLQLKQSLQDQPLDADNAAADFATDIARANQPSEFDALLESDASANPEEQMKNIQAAIDTLETPESLIEADAGANMLADKGFFGKIGGALKAGAKALGGGFMAGLRGGKGGKGGVRGPAGKGGRANAQAIEDCMGCRFIWKQVEMDVANARYVEDVQASFEHNCLDAQKSSVFFKACEDMYDDMYAMTDDYMSNEYTVDTMCRRANMCKRGKKKGGLLKKLGKGAKKLLR